MVFRELALRVGDDHARLGLGHGEELDVLIHAARRLTGTRRTNDKGVHLLCRRNFELPVIPRHRADHKSVLFVLQLREKGNGKLSELFHFLLRHP